MLRIILITPTARSGCKEKWLLMFDLGELHTRPPLTLCCVLLTDHRNVDEVGGGSTLLLPGRGRNLQQLAAADRPDRSLRKSVGGQTSDPGTC